MKFIVTTLLLVTLGFFRNLSGQEALNLAGSHLDYWGGTESILLSNRTAYISTENLGLLVYDLEDPSHPARLHRWRQFRLEMLGEWNGYLTGVTGEHLVFIDVSNPDEPQLVSTIEAHNVASYRFSDTLCFISTYHSESLGIGNGSIGSVSLSIYGVSDPQNPNLRYSQEQSWFGVRNRNFVNVGFDHMIYFQGYLYASQRGDGLLGVWNTRSADTLELVAELASHGGQGLVIQGEFLLDINSRLVTLYSLADPVAPDSIGSLRYDYSGVCIRDTLLYRVSYFDSTLQIIDISDFQHPNPIGQLRLPVRPLGWFAVSNDAGIILTERSAMAEIIDLTELSSPELSSVIGAPGSIAEVWKFGDLLFSYVNGEGLIISDCTERTRPVQVSLLPLHRVTSVVMQESYAIVSVDDKVIIYNLAEPTAPEQVTAIAPQLGSTYDVELFRNALYVAGHNGLKLYDINNIRSPRLVSTIGNRGVAELQIVDALLLAREGVTASVFSIANPFLPRLIAPYERENRERDQAVGMLAIDKTLFLFRIFNPAEDEYPPILDVIDISQPDSARLIRTHYSGSFEAQFGWSSNINGRLGMVYQDRLHIYSLNAFHDYGPTSYAWYQLQPYSRGASIVDGDYLYVTTPGGIDIYDARPLAIESDPDFILHPSSLILSEPFPNPFNSSTTIMFGLDKSAPTRLAVYDLSGRLVANLLDRQGRLSYGAGRKITPPTPPAIAGGDRRTVVWDAGNIPAGVYLVRLEAGEKVTTRKVVLMR